MSALRHGLVAMLLGLTASGCAYFRTPPPDPPGFERIALQSQVEMAENPDFDGELAGDTDSESAVLGVSIGLPVGAVTGGATGWFGGLWWCTPALAAGPIGILGYAGCVVISTFVGIVVGGLGGAFAGGSQGLPWTSVNEVNLALDEAQKDRDFQKAFNQVTTAAISRNRKIDQSRADAVVTARLDEVDLRQHVRQRLSIRMHASMIQDWDASGEAPKSRTCSYTYTSEIMDLEDWLLHDGRLFGETFIEGMDTVARWMARDLDAFAAKRAEPETDAVPATCFQPEG